MVELKSHKHFLVSATLLLMTMGCSSSEFKLVPVSGIVTLDGEPLPAARVAFEPLQTPGGDPLALGPASYGETDGNGRYELTSLNDDFGAVVGKHRVRISTYLAKFDPARTQQQVLSEEKIPAHYRGKQALEFQVPAGGTEVADFALKTTPSSGKK